VPRTHIPTPPPRALTNLEPDSLTQCVWLLRLRTNIYDNVLCDPQAPSPIRRVVSPQGAGRHGKARRASSNKSAVEQLHTEGRRRGFAATETDLLRLCGELRGYCGTVAMPLQAVADNCPTYC
jgi:hypothetical protein